ncbi:MAG: PAS domain S-box protein [Verrucomicrobia bacterium]|nr:PAS domain S-box protein [Verrucomicrobiota bacterium]
MTDPQTNLSRPDQAPLPQRVLIAAGTIAGSAVAALGLAGAWMDQALFPVVGGMGMDRPTAIAVLGVATAFGVLTASRDSRGAQRLGLMVGWMTVIAALAGGTLGAGAWRMSPISVALVVATGAGVLLLHRRPSGKSWRRLAGLILSADALAASVAVALVYAAGVKELIAVDWRSTSPWTAVCFAALNFSVLTRAGLWTLLIRKVLGGEVDRARVVDSKERLKRDLVVAGLSGLLALVLLIGLAYLRMHAAQVRVEIEREFRVVAAAKADRVAAWWQERRSDAEMLRHSPAFGDEVARLSSGRADAAQRARMEAFLEQLRTGYGYAEVMVYGADLELILPAAPGTVPWAPLSARQSAALRAEQRVQFEDFHLSPGGDSSLDLLVPLTTGTGGFAGALRLVVDPRSSAFSKVMAATESSGTVEHLLFRRDGDAVLYLSELRHRPGAALKLRVPVSDPHLLAAMALRGGQDELLEGRDYRGMPVMGVACAVDRTPWMLLSKIEVSEAYAAVRAEALKVGAGLVMVLSIVSLGVGVAWRQHRHGLVTRQLAVEQAQRELAQRLGLVMQQANDAIILFDDAANVVEFNARALEFYRHPAEEMRRLKAPDLAAPESRDAAARHLAEAGPELGVIFKAIHQRQDGGTFPVEVNARPVEFSGRRHVLSVIRDVTQRYAHEREIERLNRLYFVISQINQAIVHVKSREALFAEVCRVLVGPGEFLLAWIGWQDQASQLLVPVAVDGRGRGYVEGITVSIDAEKPEGRGPSGIAFREGRTRVCNDYFAETVTAPWRERAARHGVAACIALPLRCEGEIVGVLSIYSAERGFFGRREIELLEESAGDVSFSLDVMAGEARRRLAEQAQRESESRLGFLLSATPAVIYSIRATGDHATTFISDNVREVLGYQPADFTGSPLFWLDRLHPADAGTAIHQLGDAAALDRVERQYRFRHADGTYRWMHDEIRVVRDAAGLPLEYVGYWIDITARKTAEGALQAREQIFSSIVGQAVDAIVLIEVETGRFVEFNAAAHEMLGYTREEFAERRIVDFDAEKSENRIRQQTALIIERGQAVFETTQRHKDGSPRATRVSARLIRLEGRDFITAIWSDITELKAAEAEFRKLSLVVEQSPTSIVVTDLSGAIEYVNPHFTAVTGYTLDELRGRNPRLLKSGLTADAVYADLWRAIVAGAVWRGEIINRKKTGEIFTELVVVAPVCDAEGKPMRFVAIKEDITLRKQAEENLRKLSRAVEQSPLSVAITDLSGAIEYVNPRFTEVTGYTLAEVMGQNPRVLKSGETPAEVYTEMWRTLTQHRIWRGELRNRKKNGDIYIELAVIAPVVDDTGRTTHYVALKEDITERKRTEAALEVVQERYRLIAENTADVIWLYDVGADSFTYLSPSCERLLGFSPEEMLAKRLTDTLAPESAAEIARLLPVRIAALTAGDESARTRFNTMRQGRKDGSVIDVEVMSTLLTDSGGRVNRIVGITRDVGERLRAAEALRRSEELYRLIADNTSDVIWILDLATRRFTYMSPAAERLIGRTPEELVGQPITVALTPAAVTEAQASIVGRLAAYRAGDLSQQHRVAVYDYRHRSGGIMRAEVVSTLLLNARGEPDRMLGVSRDVTERERAAAQLRQSRDRLAKAEQMAQLGNWQLDLRTNRLVWSDEIYRIFEIDPQRFGASYEAFVAAIHPDDRELVNRAYRESVEQRTRYSICHRLLFPGGRIKYVQEGGETFYTGDGTPLRSVGTVQDITERKLVEVELHDLVKQLRAMHTIALALDRPDLTGGRLLTEIARHLTSALRQPGWTQATVEIDGDTKQAGAEGVLADKISAEITVNGRRAGAVTAGYVEPCAWEPGSRFTVQEHETIASIARSIGLSLSARESFAAVQRFNTELEEKVRQRTAELAARTREVQALLESIPDLVMRLRIDGTVLLVQRARGSAPLDAFIDRTADSGRLPHADPLGGATLRLGRRSLAQTALTTEEIELPAAGGCIDVRVAPVGEGEFVAFLRDVTERKRVETALRRSESTLQLMFEALPFGFLVVDSRTDAILQFNQRFCELWGVAHLAGAMRSGELKHRDLIPHCLPALVDAAAFAASLVALQDEANRAVVEDEIEFKADRTIRRFTKQIRDEGDGYHGRFHLFEDVTAQKNLARETAAMLERERQVSEMKTRFISVTSHEFRTPMAAAMGSVDLLHNHFGRLTPAKREELFDRISHSMVRMTEMLDDVLTLSRLDAGRMTRKLVPADLRAYLHSVVDEVRLGDRDAHRFGFQTVGDASGFPTDLNLLHHILSNLLSNAARYSPAGTEVTARLTVDAARAVFAVEDRGIGIPETDQARIFEPFERGSNVGTIKGTGLGLSIVKRMTELLGGHIAIEGVPGGGTRFVVELPRQSHPL